MADQIIEQLKTCAKCGKAKGARSFYSRNPVCRSCRPFPHIPIAQRFWAKVDINWGQGPKNNCWQWTGAITSEGYGNIGTGIGSKTMPAHKLSYILAFGPIPEGTCVLHECDNRQCVRPLHLFLGTKKDNFDDMIKKQRESPNFKARQGKGNKGNSKTFKKGHPYYPRLNLR